MSQLNATLIDAQATETLGQALAAVRPARAMVQLHGDLGAGKSTLARALLRALGVTGPIRSPTYTLVERYPLGTGDEAWHLDLYRIGQAGELDFLGLDEGSASLWLVEWPERGAGALPPVDLDVELAVDGDGRSVTLLGRSDTGRGWLARLSGLPQLQSLCTSSQEE
ncbi:tRNA (adenosine(37)-N6)-threonylcarbamoyltransferase complex ATPase subunit type 1 TsaE [Xanthomonas arboricola]|uniref:tRNA (adenosine(37)-N6)-threonylcarbamoyltransferase complex ATPase subunit type 1 TsaE n=1 Tax=Xanthomonas arboricola TaxID=56448 RepID=UPI00063EC742|nr:tRNA (adenosine(37)-N6)-threonylcarbamoyltransferase complex ATPase subunit type 1 TsaE [Xanthomonas arboricola]MBB3849563.1 tRNA threonylcarbamoyladenosine biosynthesis protein TsaE [Xanthomonas arboricola]PPT22005.1 tRNA (adenosine(37)-N6)-threonylcarbamoyltransferase complex ATPase subunit type 1 TsaE [Xanthomonas arboricola]